MCFIFKLSSNRLYFLRIIKRKLVSYFPNWCIVAWFCPQSVLTVQTGDSTHERKWGRWRGLPRFRQAFGTVNRRLGALPQLDLLDPNFSDWPQVQAALPRAQGLKYFNLNDLPCALGIPSLLFVDDFKLTAVRKDLQHLQKSLDTGGAWSICLVISLTRAYVGIVFMWMIFLGVWACQYLHFAYDDFISPQISEVGFEMKLSLGKTLHSSRCLKR